MVHQLKRLFTFFQKIHAREILACLLLLFGFYFFRQQQAELTKTFASLRQAHPFPLLLSGSIGVIAILLQAGMYRSSFASVGSRLTWPQAMELFLKRNLLSVFMPGGGVSALWYIPKAIRTDGNETVKIHQASGLFTLTGILSVILVGVPVLLLNIGSELGQTGLWTAVLLLAALAAGGGLYYVFKTNKKWSAFFTSRYPDLTAALHRFSSFSLHYRHVGRSLAASVGVELCGILLVYLAILSVGAPPSLSLAAFAYIVSILLMMASPFLKGLGAIELCIVYVLTRASYAPGEALAIALLYRFFEFWLPLLVGVASFLAKGKRLFLRVFPAFTLLFLGLVNIFSVLTPPVTQRLHWIRHWVPSGALHVTNLFVLFMGLSAVVCAAYLARGLRNAWWLALLLALLSVSGHLIKALDYEEAIVALGVFGVLLATRKYYQVRSSSSFVYRGAVITLAASAAVLLYGFVGFYFLHKRDFGSEFSTGQSALYALRGFLLLPPGPLEPLTRFGVEFQTSFQIMSLATWLFFLYYLVKPHLQLSYPSEPTRVQAAQLLQQFSTSSNDYFKISDDKLLFLSSGFNGFIAYRVANRFAVVLGEPVCDANDKKALLEEFEGYCKKFGLKPVFYRVDEQAMLYFQELKKKKVLIGQEALLDVSTFVLTGRDKKSLRNGLNSLQQKGYVTQLCAAPHEPSLLTALQRVSDEWLSANKKKELAFAQGTFDAATLQHQDLVVTFSPQGQPVAFLNIIPDLAPGECTYDLIRKTTDAPGGCMDALIIELINYAKNKGLRYLNLGMVPFSGITTPEHPAEKVLRYAYTRVKPFRSYQGLRNFKEKYASQWINKYIVFDHDIDLLPLCMALKKVMRYHKPKRVAV